VPVRYGAVRRRSQKELSREQGQKIPAQRQAELLALLRERGAAPISDLSVALQASESTCVAISTTGTPRAWCAARTVGLLSWG
jgi:hypothetical protein